MKKINRLLDNTVMPRACQALASFTRSSRWDAAKGSGQNRHEHPLDLVLRATPELTPERREHQPVQQAGGTTNPEDELPIVDVGKVGPENLDDSATDAVEAGTEPIPALRRIEVRS